ncbi:hypothetical protein [Brevibacillus gelatini]|nr:hypothetical protein [Brevibacillus gelatini]
MLDRKGKQTDGSRGTAAGDGKGDPQGILAAKVLFLPDRSS